MLFRLLLIISVLLASAEGAPIFIRIPRSQEQIGITEENVTVPPRTSEDTVYKIVIPAVVFFIAAVIIGAIAIICCCLEKKKPTKDVEGQNCTDDFTESNTNLNGKHEDDITVTTDESPQVPGNDQRDVLTGNKILVPGPPDVVINISPDEVTSSDRKHEDNITITYDDSLHGPRNEQRDVFTGNKISVPGPPDVVNNISPDEDEVTSSDRDHEVKRTDTNDDVLHRPEAEKGDVFKETKSNMAHPTETIITSSLDGNEVIPSDIHLIVPPRTSEDRVTMTYYRCCHSVYLCSDHCCRFCHHCHWCHLLKNREFAEFPQ
ncbi:uncharacterized protein LOC143787368 [Ranitomeya variabilis]|uniref:uncharacterized protein LOC143787368 n=1 Tax=Ranitomeya variabilis TaxID=490064 RepID=UPI0040578D4D